MSNTPTANPSQALKEMVPAVLIGADRAGSGVGTPGTLLDQAAVHSARRRAGIRPQRTTERLPTAPLEAMPAASPGAIAALRRLLADPDAGLITEWAELASARRARVADAAVPELLEWWSRQPSRQDVVFHVTGRLGEWLASLNPSWRKPVARADVPADADEIWQTGTGAERAALLATVRRCDAKRGLALVQSTWKDDSADERKRFVQALAKDAGMEDEPFLEAALDDKSEQVRAAAAETLKSLKGSRLRARMNDRARALFSVGGRGLLRRAPRITLSPPEAFDPAWARDGISEKGPSAVGPRAWWMREIIEHADLDIWTEATKCDPADVIKALSEDEFAGDALAALVGAASNQNDRLWSTALIDVLLAQKELDLPWIQRLLDALTTQEREEIELKVAEQGSLIDRWSFARRCDHQWSRAFSSKMLRLLRSPEAPKAGVFLAWDAAELVSRRVAPEEADLFEQTVRSLFAEQPTDSFTKSINRAHFRAEMHREFAR